MADVVVKVKSDKWIRYAEADYKIEGSTLLVIRDKTGKNIEAYPPGEWLRAKLEA